MKNKKALIFIALIGGGVFVVWLLGVREGESLLGGHRVKPQASENGESPFKNTPPGADVSLKDAVIPVHSPSKDDPNVLVKRYVIHIGETVGEVSRRTHAKRAQIEIYNGEPKPNEKMVAKVKSDEAELDFAGPPDAAAGFRDTALETMSLKGNVVVDYLDDQGNSQARLDCEQLDVTDVIFHVPGRAIVTQEGMRVEGDGLVYHKDTGAFSFEKNCHVEGTQFGLPVPGASDVAGATADASVPKTLKTIDCRGPLTFTPADKSKKKEKRVETAPPGGGAIPTDQNFGSLDGGLLTFHDDVVGKQEGSTLTAQVLEVTLTSAPETEPKTEGGEKKKSSMQVNHAVATGTPGKPAVLDDPQGRLEGGVLILDRGEAGQVVVLQNDARIVNAKMGGAGGAEKLLNAGARTEIRFHPDTGAGKDAGALAQGLGSAKTVRLELKDDAWLETRGATPADDLHIEGQRLDLEFAKSGDTEESLQLRNLTATGNAKGVIPQGTFTGDEIVVAPREGATDSQDFTIAIQPNPSVELASDLPGGGKRAVRVECTGRLDYTPPGAKDVGGVAIFTGKNNLTVKENDVVTSTLDAAKSLTIELNPDGEQEALKSMIAVGDVHFDSPQQRIKGVGDRLKLEPGSKGSQTFTLYGAPAVARATDTSGKENVVDAQEIQFDPDAGKMHALRDVHASFVGLALAQSDAGGTTSESDAPGALACEDLTVYVPADGGPTTLEARTKVKFDDPGRAISARSQALHYSEATKVAIFDGPQDDPAEVTRTVPATADQGARTLTVAGPRIILEQETSVLTCPIRGRVTIWREAPPGAKGVKDQRISAWSSGPVRYVSDRLILRDEVVVGFDEDDREVRSLRSDLATVYFAEKADAKPSADAANGGLGGPGGGIDRIVAEGRVHMEQRDRNKDGKLSRELLADGQSFEWIGGAKEEVMILIGSSPQSTVIETRGARRLRYDADRFVMHNASEEIEAENGRMTFID